MGPTPKLCLEYLSAISSSNPHGAREENTAEVSHVAELKDDQRNYRS